jgi:HTH-type transcriptional regulator / antitoxin HigA
MSAKKIVLPEPAPESYEELCRLHAPRPIRRREEYEIASKVVDWIAVRAINGDQEDYAALMGDLVNAYETEHLPQPEEASGLEVLKMLMQEHGLRARQLAEALGVDESMGSKILHGQRNITLEHARKLGEFFGVKPAVFLDLGARSRVEASALG